MESGYLENRDENGFIRLTRTNKKDEDEPKKEKKSKQAKKVKFKKGSWKHRLYKLLEKWKSSPFVIKGHFVKLKNLLVVLGKDGKSIEFTEKLKNKNLDGDVNRYVLINCYNGIYTRISSKAYKKLCLIDKISISFRLEGSYDETESYDVYQNEFVIDNINDLLSFVNFHRCGIEGVYEMMCSCCTFTLYDYHFKVVVLMRDGTVKTYKSDLNDFMKEFDLIQF